GKAVMIARHRARTVALSRQGETDGAREDPHHHDCARHRGPRHAAGGRDLGRRSARSAPVHWRPVFDTLSDRLGSALGDLRRKGKLDDESISRAMREIRLALLEADVNLEVVRGFVDRVRERALGEEVLRGLPPGQHVVKVVHEELTDLLGDDTAELELGPRSVILLAGLQGSGKTTAAAKLAKQLKERG